MAEQKFINIGIIGVGGIAMGTHYNELKNIKNCKIAAICDTDTNRLKERGDILGIPEELRFTDYKQLIDCDKIDAVEVCTPNNWHPEMAAYAIEKGKPVNIEKPLGLSVEHAKVILDAQEKYGTDAMVCFSYRFKSAVRYAKKLLSENAIGDILGVNVKYLKDSGLWEGRRLEWRFQKEYGGTGVLGDLGVHLIDMCTFLVGDIKQVFGKLDIIVKKRQRLDSDEWADVTTDDACNFIATLENGATANFSISRCVLGHSNTITFEIFGTDGIIAFDLNHPDELQVCIGTADKECGGGLHKLKVPGKYGISQEGSFVEIARGNEPVCHPTVKDGIKCQKILDAVLLSSETGKAVDIV